MTETTIALTPWKSDKDKAEAELVEAKGLLEEMDGFTVKTQDDLEFIASALAEIKGTTKAVTEMRDRVVHPINDALKELRSWFMPVLYTLFQCEAAFKDMIAEAHRQIHEKQRQALQAAAAASMAGDATTASEAMEVATTHEFEPVKGLSMRHTWDYEIEDFELVPREYLLMDDKKTKAVIRAHKGNIIISGIKVVRRTSVASASSKS